MIKHIVALSSVDGAIGLGNKLPWHIPEDLKRFQELTMGETIYMGFNTFQSILPYMKNGQFLPGRGVLVVSSTPKKALERSFEYGQKFDNVVFTSVDDLTSNINKYPDREYIIVGGSLLYAEYTPDVIEATFVNIEIKDADAFYPVNLDNYKLVSKSAIKLVDGKTSFSFCKYVKAQ